MARTFTQGHRKLIAWQEAKSLTLKIYGVTQEFPPKEQFGITSQMRRASSSAMANLAEGSAMTTKPHRNSFYERARGSVIEVDNFMELSFELHYCTKEQFEDIADHAARLSYLITQLMR